MNWTERFIAFSGMYRVVHQSRDKAINRETRRSRSYLQRQLGASTRRSLSLREQRIFAPLGLGQKHALVNQDLAWVSPISCGEDSNGGRLY